MKIGLYIQDYRKNSSKEFKRALSKAAGSALDLLVFPENCYTPFPKIYYCSDILNEQNREAVRKKTLEISSEAECAVIIGAQDLNGLIYNVYANYAADEGDSETGFYLKHTMADASPLGFSDYDKSVSSYFRCVLLKGKRIGMTICYDCNHSPFSRAYKKDNADILINSTGGNVVYTKWYRYSKVRALENNCFNFCTMGYFVSGKDDSYCFGFTPNGKLMEGVPLFKGERIGNIFMYDTDTASCEYEDDISLQQQETPNPKGIFTVKANELDKLLSSAKKLEENIFIHPAGKESIVICILEGDEILKPEAVLGMLYNPKLKTVPAKKYLLVNRFGKVDRQYYNTVLSDVLKVRSMENFCAVLFVCDDFTKCFQCGFNRTAQAVLPQNEAYTLDTVRMSGPEAIWKNKAGIRADWRKGFEGLIKYIAR